MHVLKFKLLTSIICLFSSLLIYAQDEASIKQELQAVTTIETARAFVKEHSHLNSKIYTYNQEKHTNDLSKQLFQLEQGETLVVKQKNNEVIYKVISITPTKHYRASYIYFNGKKMDKSNILTLRQQLKERLLSGSEFKDIAGQFSMDRNASRGGDLGWFEERYMFPEFIEGLNTHNTDDLFFIDLVDKNKYYLVKKTDEQKNINLLTVLKVNL
ncbi:MAG: peptidylprolyl isomerase [Flavobacteriaceae bacterium]